jgi:hypothetical protein
MNPISRFKLILVLFVTGLLFLTTPAPVQAQQQPDDTRSSMNNPTVKEYGRAGYSKITVYVWGNADTGVWRVEEGTDLLEFVSVVSRIQMANRDPDRRQIETLRIYRDRAPQSGDDPFFEKRVETLFTKRGAYPALKEGDILVLETRAKSRFTWRDVAQVTGTIAAVVNTYLLLDRLGDE